MKKPWREYRVVIILFVVWRVLLAGIERAAPLLWPLREGFLGPNPWLNFDGVHYLSIARNGYFTFQQAFFPFFPNLIRWVSSLFLLNDYVTAIMISHVMFLLGLILYYRLAQAINKPMARWSVILLLLFPTSYYFAAGYTESLFFFLSVLSLYAAGQKRWWVAGIAGMLASNTRLFGVFLFPAIVLEYLQRPRSRRRALDIIAICLIPVGLLAYMVYLGGTIADPLAFFHSQPAFGAGRSGSTLILLPQVVFRYTKIFLTATPNTVSYAVAIFEFITLILGFLLVYLGYRQRLRLSLLLYSLLVILTPTLTGTLSSLPRYILSAFPLFFVLGNVHNRWIKAAIAILFIGGLFVSTAAFLQGYFVA